MGEIKATGNSNGNLALEVAYTIKIKPFLIKPLQGKSGKSPESRSDTENNWSVG